MNVIISDNCQVMRKVFALTIASILFSCNVDINFQQIVPQNVDQLGRKFTSDIQKGNIDECLLLVIEEMNNEEGRNYLSNAHNVIRNLDFDSTRIINVGISKLTGETVHIRYSIDYEHFVKKKYLYISLEIIEQGNELKISGIDYRILETSLAEVNSLSLRNKSFTHYLFLVITILVPIFIGITLVFAIKSKLKRKWMWIIGIIFGIGKISINWTSGQLGFQFVSIQLFGVTINKIGPSHPYIFSFAIPLVATLFWIANFKKV